MNITEELKLRSKGVCEICLSNNDLIAYQVPPSHEETPEAYIYICHKCNAQIQKKEQLDEQHWRCLETSIWSEISAVQVVSWRMLNRLRDKTWATDLLDMMYLDDELLHFAKKSGDHESEGEVTFHRDTNNTVLQSGDTVVIIKDLDVKGSSLVAKMGTVVKNIRLVEDNVEQIEGKVEGQAIVILTKYVRKSN